MRTRHPAGLLWPDAATVARSALAKNAGPGSAGISLATLRQWQDQPEFDAAYRKARRKTFGQQVARLQQASGAAVTTLLKLAVDSNAPAAVKARAAYYILTLATKAIEIEDIEARVAELERAAEQSSKGDESDQPAPQTRSARRAANQ